MKKRSKIGKSGKEKGAVRKSRVVNPENQVITNAMVLLFVGFITNSRLSKASLFLQLEENSISLISQPICNRIKIEVSTNFHVRFALKSLNYSSSSSNQYFGLLYFSFSLGSRFLGLSTSFSFSDFCCVCFFFFIFSLRIGVIPKKFAVKNSCGNKKLVTKIIKQDS